MRLNQRTYPAFDALLNNFSAVQFDTMFGDKMDAKEYLIFVRSISRVFGLATKKYYITKPFNDAIVTAMPKIMQDKKQLSEMRSEAGVIFTDKGFTIYQTNPAPDKKIVCFGFTRSVLTTYGFIDNENQFAGIGCSSKDGKPYNDLVYVAGYLNSVLVTLYFIHNCEIEEKVVKANQKQVVEGQKYLNESKSDIIILNCNWFTELIRDTPFHVKGHYRWQVHGEKFTKRKLIWISDFEKQGYHRKAAKNEKDNNVLNSIT